MMNGLIMSIKA